MSALPESPEEPSRRSHILRAIEECAEKIRSCPEGISLGELAGRLQEAAFCFVALLLAVPFFQPVSLGPFTMASGGVFIAAGWQMARGRGELRLPQKALRWHLRGKAWVRVLGFCAAILRWMARWTRPRFVRWVDGARGTKFVGWLIFAGGVLLAVPFANLPLNNTFPALMIFFAAAAWLERDGLLALVSLFWCAVTLAYFAAAGWLLYTLGSNLWSWLLGRIPF